MPIHDYSLVTGKIIEVNTKDKDSSPHYKLLIDLGDKGYCASAINAASTVGNPDLLVFQSTGPVENIQNQKLKEFLSILDKEENPGIFLLEDGDDSVFGCVHP